MEGRVDRLKQWTLHCLQSSGINKRSSGVFTFSIRKASQAPLILLRDKDDLPAIYLRTKTEVDNAALRDAIKSGEDLSGMAMLGEPSKYITIS
jgi:hypothetical protein